MHVWRGRDPHGLVRLWCATAFPVVAVAAMRSMFGSRPQPGVRRRGLAPRWFDYLRRANRHRFEPLFSAAGACWCGAARSARVHRGDSELLATPLGRRLFAREAAGVAAARPR